jgi:hypothetical protein
MAKQLVNPFERHVEKLVLAIAGLLLIGVMLKFVFSSPNKIPLGSEPVTPGVVDARLALKANEILERIRNAKPQAVEHDPKFDEFVASLEPIKAVELPLAAALAPEVPMVDAGDVGKGDAQLVAIPASPKPVFTSGRNTLEAADPQGGGVVRTPVDWVMLAIPFGVKAQSDLQKRAWGATLADVIFATPEIQRRTRKSDGTWSDGDWQTISCWPSHKMRNPPAIRLSQSGSDVVANKDDLREVAKYQKNGGPKGSTGDPSSLTSSLPATRAGVEIPVGDDV